MDDHYKEVYFDKYCASCVHSDTLESEDPCFECLDEPVNVESHKPVNWKERKQKMNTDLSSHKLKKAHRNEVICGKRCRYSHMEREDYDSKTKEIFHRKPYGKIREEKEEIE